MQYKVGDSIRIVLHEMGKAETCWLVITEVNAEGIKGNVDSIVDESWDLQLGDEMELDFDVLEYFRTRE